MNKRLNDTVKQNARKAFTRLYVRLIQFFFLHWTVLVLIQPNYIFAFAVYGFSVLETNEGFFALSLSLSHTVFNVINSMAFYYLKMFHLLNCRRHDHFKFIWRNQYLAEIPTVKYNQEKKKKKEKILHRDNVTKIRGNVCILDIFIWHFHQ